MLTAGIDVHRHRGIEIGALNNPTIRPEQGNIQFVDYASTEALKAYPHPPTVIKDNIVNVDFVWPGTGSLASIVGQTDVFDYAIASHVIEHVPNVLGWFCGVAEVLRPGGVFNLAIPDRRFTFDIGRKDSTLGEMIEAYLMRYARPSIRQEFDHCYEALAIEPGAVWSTSLSPDTLPRYSGDVALRLAFDQALEIADNDRYYDSHCWVFTPLSFVNLMQGAAMLELFPLILDRLVPTAPGGFEFYANFRKPEAGLPPASVQQQKLDSFAQAKVTVIAQQMQARLLGGG